MNELIANKYKNLEKSELEDKISFLHKKIEILRTNMHKKITEFEGLCILVLELTEMLNER
jgi:chaperonin cofactor prefoldin